MGLGEAGLKNFLWHLTFHLYKRTFRDMATKKPEMTGSDNAVMPTLEQVRGQWYADLQVCGLGILSGAAASNRPAAYIAMLLDVVRDSYQPREATYLCKFVMHHAEHRGLLSLA